MTSGELKEIEERARKASPTFALDFMKREDFDYMNRGRSDVYKLLNYIKELESQIPRWIHVIDTPPKENEEVLFGIFDPITQVFQGYMRKGRVFSDSHENSFLPVRGMYWQVLPGLPENIYKDLEE